MDTSRRRPLKPLSRGLRQTDKPTLGLRNLQRKVRIEIPALQKFAERAVTVCLERNPHQVTPLRNLSEISVLFISDKRMAELHRRFLGQHGPTDVITFDHGEIFISAETARRHAHTFRNSVLREIQLYIVHGLL